MHEWKVHGSIGSAFDKLPTVLGLMCSASLQPLKVLIPRSHSKQHSEAISRVCSGLSQRVINFVPSLPDLFDLFSAHGKRRGSLGMRLVCDMHWKSCILLHGGYPLIRSPQIVHNKNALLCVLVLVKKDYREPNGLTCLVLTCHSLM